MVAQVAARQKMFGLVRAQGIWDRDESQKNFEKRVCSGRCTLHQQFQAGKNAEKKTTNRLLFQVGI